jgi:menaquinone-dependent protoporphyrinogen IX oxidase
MKGIIIYKGKYGATEQYAKWLGQDLDLPVSTAEDIKNERLNAYDYFIIGSSVYMGKLQIRKWLFKNKNFIKDKRIFFSRSQLHRLNMLEKETSIMKFLSPVL